jgi:hypothetical protein
MNRKKIEWRDQAKAQLRAIDQPTALRILHALANSTATGEGDVKRLQCIEPPSSNCVPATAASASTIPATPSTSPPSGTAAKRTADLLTMEGRAQRRPLHGSKFGAGNVQSIHPHVAHP